jgi:hypothetical protein
MPRHSAFISVVSPAEAVAFFTGQQIDIGPVPSRFNPLDSLRRLANNDNRT